MGGTLDVAPATIGVLLHLDHGHPVGVDLGAHLVRRTLAFGHVGRAALGRPQRVLVDVFVVHHQQEALGGRALIQRERMHAVVMHADAGRLGLGRHRQILAPFGRAVVKRRTPGHQHLGGIARRHHHGVAARTGNRLEGQRQRRLGHP